MCVRARVCVRVRVCVLTQFGTDGSGDERVGPVDQHTGDGQQCDVKQVSGGAPRLIYQQL